jgi:hypothetical protein
MRGDVKYFFRDLALFLSFPQCGSGLVTCSQVFLGSCPGPTQMAAPPKATLSAFGGVRLTVAASEKTIWNAIFSGPYGKLPAGRSEPSKCYTAPANEVDFERLLLAHGTTSASFAPRR